MEIAEIGRVGEEIACRFLQNKGHKILDRNFRVKSGEIDIVSKDKGVLSFSEVKTVLQDGWSGVDGRPEERVNPAKLLRLSRAARVYLSKMHVDENCPLSFLVIAVKLDVKNKIARVKMIDDVLL